MGKLLTFARVPAIQNQYLPRFPEDDHPHHGFIVHWEGLQRRVEDMISDHLAEHDWQPTVRQALLTPVKGRFWRPAQNGFAATVQLICEPINDEKNSRKMRGTPMSLRCDADIGITHAETERWLRACGSGFWNAGIEVSVGSLLDPPSSSVVHIESPEQIALGVRDLVSGIEVTSWGFTEQHASIDAFISYLQADPALRQFEVEVVPVMFAAYGLTERAQEALAQYRGLRETESSRRVARQLERLIQGTVTIAELEATPADSRDSAYTTSETLMSRGQRSRKRKEAVAAARQLAGMAPRNTVRNFLEAELAKRGLTESPRWLEATVDTLDPTTPRLGRYSLSQLIRIVGDAVKLLRRLGKGKEYLSESAQELARPSHATYPIGVAANEWAAVRLDNGCEDWLDHVYTMSRLRIGNSTSVEVWLDWDQECKSITVAIGEQRVGLVPPDVQESMVEVMRAATERGELPWMRGRLTVMRGERNYLLEIPLPVT